MVTRGKVVSVSDETVKVYIPKFGLIEEGEGEPQVEEYLDARIATVPGCKPHYEVNDIVFICIEDNDLGSPVVMGLFIPDNAKDDSFRTSDAILKSLQVVGNKEKSAQKNSGYARLPYDTTIGDVTKDNIKCLEKVHTNIQDQFDENMAQKILMLEYLCVALDKYSKEIIME
jgi:hypothetical protein